MTGTNKVMTFGGLLRVCAAADGTNCTSAVDLATNDDSGCGMMETCSQLMFTCPASGRYNVFRGSYDSTAASTCTVGVSP